MNSTVRNSSFLHGSSLTDSMEECVSSTQAFALSPRMHDGFVNAVSDPMKGQDVQLHCINTKKACSMNESALQRSHIKTKVKREADAAISLEETMHGILLPETFQPQPYSVVIGRGKIAKDVVGNRRLRVLASMHIAKYSQAKRKGDKTQVVSLVARTIRDACPVGAFVRYKHGRWYEVEDTVAHEKVGYTFRELIGEQYRSSSKAKVVARMRRKETRKTYSENTKDKLAQTEKTLEGSSLSPFNSDIEDLIKPGFSSKDIETVLSTNEHHPRSSLKSLFGNSVLKDIENEIFSADPSLHVNFDLFEFSGPSEAF